jgi:selenocysteine lyase/cysteine desulfurase
VALTHASNILGTLNPIKDIASFVHDRGAMICVDGVAYAPHRLVDVRDLDVDFYAFSFYKVYGPHYSLLYGKKKHLEGIPGFNHFFLEEAVPYKFQPGNVNYELSYSLLGVKEYFTELAGLLGGSESELGIHRCAALAYEAFAGHEEKLCARLMDFLNGKSNVRIIGRKEWDRHVRVPTVSFVIDGVRSSTIPPELDRHKIAIRYGDFYARRLIDDLGLAPQDGVIRVSLVHYNSAEEVDRLIEVLDRLI